MKIGMKRSLRHTGYLWMLLAMPLAASTVHVYVANHGGTTISVIDAATDKVVDVIENIEVPEAVHFSPRRQPSLYLQRGRECTHRIGSSDQEADWEGAPQRSRQ